MNKTMHVLDVVARPLRVLLRASLLCFFVASLAAVFDRSTFAGEPALAKSNDEPDEVTVSMWAGGSGRYVVKRWGLVRGNFVNDTDTLASSLVVVTPTGSGGLQFARKVELPPQVAFDSLWPVYVSDVEPHGSVDFRYLFYPDGTDDGVIRHAQNEKEIPSFSGVTQRNGYALTGMVGESGDRPENEHYVHQMLGTMRHGAIGNASVVYLIAADLAAGSECLDAFDQIAITDSQLLSFPAACEAIRLWVLRGGRLHIAMDRTGPAVAEGLLGESFPFTVLGETSTNRVTLELNPDYPLNQFSVRQVTREFDEPVRYVRMHPAGGEIIWRVDGWPVAVRAAVGQGTVLITTLAVEAFSTPSENLAPDLPVRQMISSSRRMADALFAPRVMPLLSESAVGDASAALIGYQIPSRMIALLLLVIFPVCLLAVGIFLQRRSQGQRLVYILPALAIVAAVPAAGVGLQIRSVAPATVIETAVVQASAGFTELPSDGYATCFVPAPEDLAVSSTRGARLDLLTDATNSDYRRLTWTSPRDVSWMNLRQPAGLRTYSVRSTRVLESPLRAFGVFDENGLRGQLRAGEDLKPGDAFFAGVNHDNLAVTLSADGTFRAGAGDALAFGQFFRSTLLTDDQILRGRLLYSVFSSPESDRYESFPAEPSLVFWDEGGDSSLEIANPGLRRQRSVLYVVPIELLPPEAGRKVSIPPQMLSFRSVSLANGGMSSVYSNMKRQWLTQESEAVTLLEFEIPPSCLPFAVDEAELELVVRAGSRIVSLQSGPREAMQPIAELRSPLGAQTIRVPVELIRETCRAGKVWIQISVSDLDSSMKADDLSGEQDDSWQIERVLLSLRGHREP